MFRPVPHRWRKYLLAAFAAVLVSLLLRDPCMDCSDPEERETSPDQAWTLTLCRRPRLFAMPGDGGGGPGWAVLRDAAGGIRGIVDMGSVQSYRGGVGMKTKWERDRVLVPLALELPLIPASGPVGRWMAEQAWRLRARLGLVPTDDMFR